MVYMNGTSLYSDFCITAIFFSNKFLIVFLPVLNARSKTKYQIVLTKTDLAFPVDVARRAMQIEEVLFMRFFSFVF